MKRYLCPDWLPEWARKEKKFSFWPYDKFFIFVSVQKAQKRTWPISSNLD